MTDYLINQLYLNTNVDVILKFLKTKTSSEAPAQFTLNSITAMPEELNTPPGEEILSLSAMTVEIPEKAPYITDNTLMEGLDGVFFGQKKRQSEAAIQLAIKKGRERLRRSSDESSLELFELAIENYQRYGFFSQYDWRVKYWGTPEDIFSINESTFTDRSEYLEFTTAWLPPIAALEKLAHVFPSIKYKLKYRYRESDPQQIVDIFPFPPFGY